eukprot:11175830-Lingulodinium_polyedra.AAC.1
MTLPAPGFTKTSSSRKDPRAALMAACLAWGQHHYAKLPASPPSTTPSQRAARAHLRGIRAKMAS